MPVKLRLRRLGRSHAAFYHIVAADSRAPRDGKYIEKVGTYNPITATAKVEIDHALALKWLKTGAQPTETVRALLSHDGVMLKLHLHRKGKTQEEIEAGFAEWASKKEGIKAKELTKTTSVKEKLADERLAQERKKSAERAAKIAAKIAVAEPVVESHEPVAETVKHEIAAEAVVEAPATEEVAVSEAPLAEAGVQEQPEAAAE